MFSKLKNDFLMWKFNAAVDRAWFKMRRAGRIRREIREQYGV